MATDLEKLELEGAVRRLTNENQRLASDNAALMFELDRMREMVEGSIRDRFSSLT